MTRPYPEGAVLALRKTWSSVRGKWRGARTLAFATINFLLLVDWEKGFEWMT